MTSSTDRPARARHPRRIRFTSFGTSWRHLVSIHGPAARVLIGFGLLCGLFLALASSVVLHGLSLVAVVVTAGLAACVAAGTRDGRAAACAAAWKAAGWTVAIIVLVAGLVVLAGGAVAAVVSGMTAAAGAAVWLRRFLRARSASRDRGSRAPRKGAAAAAPVSLSAWLDRSPAPVSLLPIPVLGSEWSRTTAALATRLEPAARQVVVRRRQEVLDELERRDPDGFARWLAAGAAMNSDPATFVRRNRTTGSDAA
jgi:hypothetical protein